MMILLLILHILILGNIFLSGYSPQLLSLLNVNFDLENIINGMVEEYKKQYNSRYSI